MTPDRKQMLANLIQSYEQVLRAARTLYSSDLEEWAMMSHSFVCLDLVEDVKRKLKEVFYIDYDAADAKGKVIKEGSRVEVLADHMEGMKGSTAIIKAYSLPANVSDIIMKDGMKMQNHKWLTNEEVKLK